MIPERMNFLDRFDRFYQVLVEQIKQEKISEADFYVIIGAKAKSLDRDRREANSRVVKVIGIKRAKTDLKF